MIPSEDLAYCTEAIRHGSRSFHAASRLLPGRVRDPALVLYAFCRLADDAVDLQPAKEAAVARLHERQARVYAGKPENQPSDKAFAAIVDTYELPRALPEALLEGLAWDASGRRYATLSELRGYGSRVASAVGAMICVLMRMRDADALARACDPGVAMQLTNMARDVGEDAREGRLYLTIDWCHEMGVDVDGFLQGPAATVAIRMMIRRLIAEGDRLYARSVAGISALPADCRPGTCAAQALYRAIGRMVAHAGSDSVFARAHTGPRQQPGCLLGAVSRSAGTMIMPYSPVMHARPLAETAFLVEASAERDRVSADWG
ncbi:MAG: phytoene/squalene synthase family protein [Roseovarius sp.]|nr:phytoene/squalene synthase family protein [Roseovarius sp.]